MFRVEGVIAECELVRVVGRCRGLSGLVYLAVDRETRRRVALKVLRADGGAGRYGGFAAERYGAELQQQLARHTALVPAVHRWGEKDGAFHVVMDYVDGEDLDTQVGSGLRLSPLRAAAIARTLCQCLSIAHEPRFVVDGVRRSIVHGDIKPENIRITSTGAVRLLDFGSATAVAPGTACAHGGGLTPEYASPERLATRTVDVRTDLWSVGVVLYEALTGRRPDETPRQHRRRRHTVARIPRSCPVALARILQRALAPYAADRYATASALRHDLDEFLCTRFARTVEVESYRAWTPSLHTTTRNAIDPIGLSTQQQ